MLLVLVFQHGGVDMIRQDLIITSRNTTEDSGTGTKRLSLYNRIGSHLEIGKRRTYEAGFTVSHRVEVARDPSYTTGEQFCGKRRFKKHGEPYHRCRGGGKQRRSYQPRMTGSASLVHSYCVSLCLRQKVDKRQY